MKYYGAFFQVILISIGIHIFLMTTTVEGQSPAPQTPVITPTIVSTNSLTITPSLLITPTTTHLNSNFEQKLSELEMKMLDTRLDTIEEEFQSIDNSFDGFWNNIFHLLEVFIQSGWFLFSIVFIVIFRFPINAILNEIPSRIGNTKFKFGDIEISVSDINDVVRQREILKTMLFIATVDHDPDPEELKEIAKISRRMGSSRLDVLKQEDKREIISAAIHLAVADGVFKDEEYGAIKSKANQYQLSEAEIDKMIIDVCISENISLPSKLQRDQMI